MLLLYALLLLGQIAVIACTSISTSLCLECFWCRRLVRRRSRAVIPHSRLVSCRTDQCVSPVPRLSLGIGYIGKMLRVLSRSVCRLLLSSIACFTRRHPSEPSDQHAAIGEEKDRKLDIPQDVVQLQDIFFPCLDKVFIAEILRQLLAAANIFCSCQLS